MKVQLALLVVACLSSALAEKARYDNYQVQRVIPKTLEQLQMLHELEETNEFSFWLGASRLEKPVDILVPPHKRAMIAEILSSAQLESTVSIQNVQELFDAEADQIAKRSTKALDWTNYYNLDDVATQMQQRVGATMPFMAMLLYFIYTWLDSVAAANDNVKVVVVGKTYEGKEIRALEITNGANNPGAIFESGIHAREWIAPAATSWIVNEIINSPADSLWRQFNYLYIPIVNGDGYEFTWNKDRAWRKTRAPYKVGPITCYGADPNRNWDFHWMDGGSSNNPCSETFAGPSANSEVEISSLISYLTTVASKYDIYISFHSFSQLILYPWGYTGTDTPLEATWKRIGTAAAKDIQAVHGKSFDVGSIFDAIYQASGSSIEWFYGNYNSTLTYAFELRDTGDNGFVLPPNQIIPSGEELIEGLRRFFTEYQALPKKVKQ